MHAFAVVYSTSLTQPVSVAFPMRRGLPCPHLLLISHGQSISLFFLCTNAVIHNATSSCVRQCFKCMGIICHTTKLYMKQCRRLVYCIAWPIIPIHWSCTRGVAQCVILRYCWLHTFSRVSCHVVHETYLMYQWAKVSLRYCLHVFFRYGFDYGSAHFVLMSTEHFFYPGSPQYQFLDAHLKAVDRTRTPWLIFAGHRYKLIHRRWSTTTNIKSVFFIGCSRIVLSLWYEMFFFAPQTNVYWQHQLRNTRWRSDRRQGTQEICGTTP